MHWRMHPSGCCVGNNETDFYPVPLLLTQHLNVNNVRNDLFELIPWLKAIVDHCNYFISYAEQIGMKENIYNPEVDDNLIKITYSHLFLKPVQVFVSDKAEHQLFARNHLLLQVFEKLWMVQ